MASNISRKSENRIANKSYKDGLAEKNARKKSSFNVSSILGKLKNFVFFIVVAYLLFSLVSQQTSISENNNKIASLENQISEEQIEIERLEQEYANIDSDEYVERMAREKLGLVQANERVFKDSSKRE